MSDVIGALRTNYPDEFAHELKSLYSGTKTDLPTPKKVRYNPVFGGVAGKLTLAADGDLLLDDTLFELKVSVSLLQGVHLWQLLGYAALDYAKGKRRIRKIGFYNPRYHARWVGSLDETINGMGGRGFVDFRWWFETKAGDLVSTAWDEFNALKAARPPKT